MHAQSLFKVMLSVTLGTACLLAPFSATAMRCGSALISKGDIQAKVVKYCGEPAQSIVRNVVRQGFHTRSGVILRSNKASISRGSHYYPYGQTEVLIEEWVFNLGPNRLMRQVRFENGIVVNVDTLDYGYVDF
jgi:hypothetical protein